MAVVGTRLQRTVAFTDCKSLFSLLNNVFRNNVIRACAFSGF